MIELRFVERFKPINVDANGAGYGTTERILQSRTLYTNAEYDRQDGTRATDKRWTEWQDVPTVRE